MDRAGAAGRHAAAELRAGEPENVAQIPEYGHRRIAVERLRLSIDMQSDHAFLPVESGGGEILPAGSEARRAFPSNETFPDIGTILSHDWGGINCNCVAFI